MAQQDKVDTTNTAINLKKEEGKKFVIAIDTTIGKAYDMTLLKTTSFTYCFQSIPAKQAQYTTL